MNGLSKKVLVVLLLAATTVVQVSALGVRKKTQTPQSVVAQARTVTQNVVKKEKPLKQILKQAEIIYTTADRKERATAVRELNRLMRQISKEMAENIKQEIDILKKTTHTAESKNKAEEAYTSLRNKIRAAKAQAKQAKVTAKAVNQIENAAPEAKPAVIAQTTQAIKNAEAEAQKAGYLSRAYSTAKGFATGNIFFGEENSTMKTAYRVVVGGAVLGGIAYGAYAYEVPQTIYGMSSEEWKNLPWAAKEAISAKMSAGLAGAKEWGAWGLEGAKGLVGYGVKQAIVGQTTAALVAATSATLAAAEKLVNDNPGDKDAMDNYNKALEANQAALEKQRLETIEEETRKLQQEEWQERMRESREESAPAA